MNIPKLPRDPEAYVIAPMNHAEVGDIFFHLYRSEGVGREVVKDIISGKKASWYIHKIFRKDSTEIKVEYSFKPFQKPNAAPLEPDVLKLKDFFVLKRNKVTLDESILEAFV